MVCGARLILSMVLPTLLIGCARLKAQVDVLDPAYVHRVRSELRLSKLIQDSSTGSQTVENTIRDICAVYKDGRLRLVDEYLEQAGQGAQMTKERSSLRDKIYRVSSEDGCVKLGPEDDEGVIDRARLRDLFREIACPGGKCLDMAAGTDSVRRARMEAAVRYQGQVDSYAAELQARIALLEELSSSALSPAGQRKTAQIKKTAEAAVQKAAHPPAYLGAHGRTLVLDEIAFAAKSAPTTAWASELNYAKGCGVFGSTDVVLKLESTGDFSVKGLVFDARSTAVAARKLGLSALKILASGGVAGPDPSPQARGSGPPDGVDEASKSLSAAKAELAVAERASESYEAALRRLAGAVIAAAENVTAAKSSAERKAARATAKGLFEANKALFEAHSGGSN